MAGISDFFKKSVLDGFTNTNVQDLVLGMVFALIISFFILFIYKTTFRGAVYNHNFAISLIVLSAISCLIICTISSNLVLSLGLVGALSLIRFRTAVKDPLDIVFLFWSISSGIACGANRMQFALIGALFIGILLLVLNMFNLSSASYLLVVKCDKENELDLNTALAGYKHTLKSKISSNDRLEYTVQIRLPKGKEDTSFVDSISEIKGVNDAIIVSYNGDYAD